MLQRTAFNFINLYQRHIRMSLPNSCRFFPTCSDYTKQAVQKYGFLKGVAKGIKRILLCHPLSHKSGYDPLT